MLINNDLKSEIINSRLHRLIDVFVSVLMMVALSAIASSYLPIYSTKARVSEALFQFPAAREKVMIDYIYSGKWPKKALLHEIDEREFDHIKRITFDGKGTIDFLFDNKYLELSGKTLSFVASQSMADTFKKIIWTCGYSEPLHGFKAIGTNRTNIAVKYLPNTCR